MPTGPFTIEKVRALLESGGAQMEDPVWIEGRDGFIRVADLPGVGVGASTLSPPPIAVPPPVVAPTGGAPRLQYEGDGGSFFKLNLVNILLTLLTFGIYAFWAKARVFQYHWRRTRFMDEPLDYHATGTELFVGFLKGFLLLAPPVVGVWLLCAYLDWVELLPIFFYLGVLLLLPFIAYAKWKFLLARTSWRNIRMQFNGRLGECYGLHLAGVILTLVTLGIYYPWLRASLDRYLIGNTYYGTEKFEYHGRGGELLPKYLLAIVLTPLTFGIYLFWFQADLLRYKWDNTSVQGIRFRNTISGGDLLGHMLLLYLTIYFTLGLAFPWAVVVFLKMKARHLSLEETPDLAAVDAAVADTRATSFGEGLGEAGEAIGNFLGG